jgi:hypothetical protein
MIDMLGNKITYLGHSTFSLTTPSGQVGLIDPLVISNPRCPESLKNIPRLNVFSSLTRLAINLATCFRLQNSTSPRSWPFLKPVCGSTAKGCTGDPSDGKRRVADS